MYTLFKRGRKLSDPGYERIIQLESKGIFFKDPNDAQTLKKTQNILLSTYGTTKVCDSNNTKCLSLEPEIKNIFKNSRDYNELFYYWKGWHDLTGNRMKDLYLQTVELNNKKSRENGFRDLSENWIEDFEDPNFEQNYDSLFFQVKPFYEQLHAYVRRKLKSFYGKHYPSTHDDSLILAHLLGNMWSQSWENIYDLVVPYPKVKSLNLTEKLINKGYTPVKMFKVNI